MQTQSETTSALSQFIRQNQSASGAFKSTVHLPFGNYDDDNAFITALVLRHLRYLPLRDDLRDVCQKAFAFIRRCESSIFPGVFGFWPEDSHPFWMGRERLNKDADDSSIIALELVRNSLEDNKYLENLAQKVLSQHRFFSSRLSDNDWRRSGVFLTWLDYYMTPNPVDCCVNANVIALLAYGGLKHIAGYQEACEMLNTAIQGTNGNQQELAKLSPYYCHPIELFFAIQNAVDAGASELKSSLTYLMQQPWLRRCLDGESNAELPICAHESGKIYWTSTVVQTVREYEKKMAFPEFNQN
jgi:hypothetical protein